MIDENVLAASRNRHPSHYLELSACGDCAFTPPRRLDTAASLRRLPSKWRAALRDRPHLLERAAFLRDEVHAVSNRIARLLVAPGSRLQGVTIDVPTAIATESSRAVVVDLLRIAVERLARIVDLLRPDDWEVHGYVENGTITVADLTLVPLHHTHRDLVDIGDGVSRAVVIPFGPRRRVADRLPAAGGVS